MASGSLGTLTLDLVAKIGGFVSGLDQAERASKKSADAIKKNIDSIGVAGYAVGNALGDYLRQGISALSNAFPELIEQAAKFQDIAEKTGGSAEGFASLAVSAKVGGASMEALTSASIKLTKNLTGVDDESKNAGAALTAIGISIEEFKKLSPDQQFLKLADSLGGYAEGSGKAAVATALLGKSGAELLPFLKELYSAGGAQKILTDQQIKQADDYTDKQAKLRAEIGLYASAIATLAIPSLSALGNAAKDLIKDLIGTNQAQSDLSNNLAILDWAEKVSVAFGSIGDAGILLGKSLRAIGGSFESVYSDAKLLESLTPSGAAAAALRGDTPLSLLKERNKKAEEANQRYVDIFNGDNAKIASAIKKSFASQRSALIVGADSEVQRLLARSRASSTPQTAVNFNGTTMKGSKGAADDPTKKLLENDLAYFKAQGEAAKDLLADRNKILDLYNSQGLLSVKDYYTQLQGNLDEATAAQAKSYDDQIAALKKFQSAASKQTDVADAQGKINKLEEDKAKLYRASGNAALESSIKQVQAQKAIQDSFNEVNAKVLEYQGNLRAAAAIRFDASNEKVLNQAKAEGNAIVERQIALLKDYTLAQADISKAQEGFNLAQGDLAIAEERISIARQAGTMGEIEALTASGRARQEAVAIMQKQLDTLLAINQASRSDAQVQQIERLKVQLEGLKATADPLADKFNTIFADSAGSALGDFISGTKTAKEAFKSFTDSIFKELTNLIVKDLFKQLFSGAGSATGGAGINFGSLLSGIFGGGSTPGFASGGFTGAGAANDPAGFVHKGEFVVNAANTSRLGVSALESLNGGGALGGGGTVINNFTVGDVASMAQVKQAVAASQAQTAARIGRSQRYAGSLS